MPEIITCTVCGREGPRPGRFDRRRRVCHACRRDRRRPATEETRAAKLAAARERHRQRYLEDEAYREKRLERAREYSKTDRAVKRRAARVEARKEAARLADTIVFGELYQEKRRSLLRRLDWDPQIDRWDEIFEDSLAASLAGLRAG